MKVTFDIQLSHKCKRKYILRCVRTWTANSSQTLYQKGSLRTYSRKRQTRKERTWKRMTCGRRKKGREYDPQEAKEIKQKDTEIRLKDRNAWKIFL